MTTESSDVDEGDSIDWDEAIETLKAAETERAFQSSRRSASTTPFASATQDPSLLQARHHTYIKAGNRSPVIVTPTDEEILFLHDLIDTNRYALVNDDGQDIEDIGMNRLAKPLGQTLYQQFRWV